MSNRVKVSTTPRHEEGAPSGAPLHCLEVVSGEDQLVLPDVRTNRLQRPASPLLLVVRHAVSPTNVRTGASVKRTGIGDTFAAVLDRREWYSPYALSVVSPAQPL